MALADRVGLMRRALAISWFKDSAKKHASGEPCGVARKCLVRAQREVRKELQKFGHGPPRPLPVPDFCRILP